MVFNRTIEKQLHEWKNSPIRKPLVIRGARQVGKTTLIKQFANSYTHKIFLNLEKKADIRFFEEYDDISTITEALFLENNISSQSIKDCLLFIDEIQESPIAIQFLRYFYEEFPDLHVIAAGSLLEFSMKNVKSFPVGRIEYLYLHPLNFQEYLEAMGKDLLLEKINAVPIKPIAHSILLKEFNQYAIIGGMPEVIKIFSENQRISILPKIYESIWITYKNDVEKYTSNNTERKVIKHILSTAYLYLDQRIKFQGFGNSNYRSREVGEAFRNLDAAKIIQLIYPTTDVEVPIKPNMKKSPRLQFLDTGLVNYELRLQSEMLALDDLSKAYKGSIIPHIITQEIISLNKINYRKPNFWVREKNQASSEVDLVLEFQNKSIPIEIKSGSTGSLKSLHQYINITNHGYAIRMYGGDFKIEQTKTPIGTPYLLMNLPYYLTTKIYEYIEYFVTTYTLNKLE